MLFGQLFSRDTFANPVGLGTFAPIAWEVQCTNDVPFTILDKASSEIQILEPAVSNWDILDPNTIGTLVREC